jgi:hypothetical protein
MGKTHVGRKQFLKCKYNGTKELVAAISIDRVSFVFCIRLGEREAIDALRSM